MVVKASHGTVGNSVCLSNADLKELCNNCHIVFNPDLLVCKSCDMKRFRFCYINKCLVDKNQNKFLIYEFNHHPESGVRSVKNMRDKNVLL